MNADSEICADMIFNNRCQAAEIRENPHPISYLEISSFQIASE